MTRKSPFTGDPDSTEERILAATYRALEEHGYSDLTIERIGNHFPKSKSLLYHHYDGKDDLLFDCLEFFVDHFEQQVLVQEEVDPVDHLRLIADQVFESELEPHETDFSNQYVQLRGQAAADDEFKSPFEESDALFQRRIAEIIRSGIEQGQFRSVDPDEAAALIQTLFVGAVTTRQSGSESTVADARRAFDRYFEEWLLAE